MDYIENKNNASIVLKIVDAIHENATYLSELDGAIGDGDHGVNMNKGFLMAKDRITLSMSLSEAMKVLSKTLIMDIGGSMGPIYGTFFSKLGKNLSQEEQIKKEDLSKALHQGVEALINLAGAKEGDKTLIDTLVPALNAFDEEMKESENFSDCLKKLIIGAEKGRDSTCNMIAKIGRASRLGERSRGHLDAGATSCCIILITMAKEMDNKLLIK